MGFLSFAVPILAAAFYVLADLMQHKQAFPKFDLFLAASTATPAAAHVAAGIGNRPVPLFTAPLLEFDFHGVPAFLTIPDCLALAASAVMLIRFLAWAIAPLRKGGSDD